MLNVRGLCKSFGRPAVIDLDLSIAAGEIYALLGPNGAGKTTTLRMVCGLLVPDAGNIAIAGIDALAEPARAKQVTAWLPDEPLLYDRLSPLEYLEFVAGLWQVPAEPARGRAQSLLTEPRSLAASRRDVRGVFARHAAEDGAGRGAAARPGAADHG
ncbi:MAG: ABC transporter ATP-binding protein [Rhodospirillales bacterium]